MAPRDHGSVTIERLAADGGSRRSMLPSVERLFTDDLLAHNVS